MRTLTRRAAPIRTLLIANRGEIALRVMRTARALGIRTVAIFTDLDVEAPHVRAATDAVRVSSYLDVDAVVSAARVSGADAVHPGYGFLSERAELARALDAAGIRLVGPSAEVIDLMGRKDAAREVALAAGVPVVPQGEPGSPGGYPVLVKAASGGGGKGMRIVRTPEEYDAAVAAAKREALAAFGDDTLLVERYVEHGRHLEVQVLADAHGNVLHLFERDCSTQRRHQKVLEEAPGPTVDPFLRHRLTTAAVELARQVGYVGAGTVEFLLDADTGEFYFLEMNTRLQVEHPVTEAVTGIDLVAMQLRVASGEELDYTQDQFVMGIHGHAIEARVYAEDAFGGFLPQAGTASIVRWPGPPEAETSAEATTVRVHHALESGQVVSTAYDPMLGKVIVHGPDRESARLALLDALAGTAVLGLTTNTGFLHALVASEEFRDATIDTAWLDTAEVPAPSPDLPRVMAAWVAAMLIAGEADADGLADPFRADGWRSAGEPAPVRIELDRPVLVDRARGTVDRVPVQQHSAADHVLVLSIDGRRHRAVVDVQPHLAEVVHLGQRFVFRRPDVLADHGPVVGDGTVLAPMPGTVLEVSVAIGDEVAEGQALGMMEAMKMELTLRAPFAGTLAAVDAVAGAQVPLGTALFHVEPAGQE
ncbi:ATP-grasp domain-containing protein [Nocardioides sp. dk4132]|uniref:acetyl/propionyl/methylcrotonyl-CoA carboxylase subunit alpha n=1 Tax=unclassified Nocardioides TaxID=2615069 RepID=UPI0012971AA6|nr:MULTISPECIES: biotin carboxylase N-terminal domain-containing protein [unclassified Nocardioides]MQW77137.1 ATP-grasp domain-containing protein [Nocardioides sp. dk4132]QGA06024.1 ATP-grasp domain-containing protein [Nocardioides sp. dk884]